MNSFNLLSFLESYLRVLKTNWVDLVIILILLYFVLDSFLHYFFVLLIEFLSFLASLLLGFRFYNMVAQIFITYFSIPVSFSRSMGFLVVVIISETILASVLVLVFKKIPYYIKNFKPLHYFRFIIGILDGLLLISFLIPLALSFPIPSIIKDSITESKIGNFIYVKTLVFEKNYKDVFGGIVDEGMNLLTVNPGSDKRVSLNISTTNLTIDYENEKSMLDLINLERQKAGVKPLTERIEAVEVARNYAKEMWNQSYFSHYSSDGENVSDRLEKAGISHLVVGENLALAPTLIVAHTGLMKSEGHRKNILEPIYRQVAIGIVDNGIYGKIFVQIFTD
jgi:hypothetical protein